MMESDGDKPSSVEKLCIRNLGGKDGDEERMPAAATETIGKVSEPGANHQRSTQRVAASLVDV